MAVIISYFGWPQTIAFKMPHNIQFEKKKTNSSRWRDRWDARMLGWSLMSADVRSNICPSKVLLQNTNPQTSYRYSVTTASLIMIIFLSSDFRNGSNFESIYYHREGERARERNKAICLSILKWHKVFTVMETLWTPLKRRCGCANCSFPPVYSRKTTQFLTTFLRSTE